MVKTTISLGEATVVTAICFGLPIATSIGALLAGFPTSPFTDDGAIWLVVVEAVLAVSALLFLHSRHFEIATLRLRPTFRGTLVGLIVYAASWLAGAIATAPFAADQAAQPISKIIAETHLSMPVTIVLSLANGAFEEIFLLGVLVRGLRGLGLASAFGLPLIARVLYHVYQGPIGVIWVLSFGVLVTTVYVRSANLWPPVFAHILADLIPLAAAGG